MEKIDFANLDLESNISSELMLKSIDFRNFKQGVESFFIKLNNSFDDCLTGDSFSIDKINKILSFSLFTQKYLSIYPKIHKNLSQNNKEDLEFYDCKFYELYNSFLNNSILRKKIKELSFGNEDFRINAWKQFIAPSVFNKNKRDRFENHFDKITNFIADLDLNTAAISENTDNYVYIQARSKNLLLGLNKETLEVGRENAMAKEKDGYLFYLDENSARVLLQTAESEKLRKHVYYKFLNNSPERIANIKLISKTLKYKKLVAEIFGKKSYIDLVSQNHIIDNAKGIFDFVNKSKNDYKPVFDIKYQSMLNNSNNTRINPWDYLYYYNKDKQINFESDPSKDYFEYDSTINNIFKKLSNLFEIKIDKLESFDYCSIFCVEDKKLGKKSHLLINRFNPSESNAYQIDLLKQDNYLQNFDGAHFIQFQNDNTNGNKCLLTYSDVVIVLHEIGHFIHSFYNNGDLAYEPSKLNLDLVELPSQFLEQFSNDYDFIQEISSHYKNGSKIPKTVFDYVVSDYEVFQDCHGYVEMVKQELITKLYDQGSVNFKDRQNIINTMLKHNVLYDITDDMFFGYNDHNFDYGPIGYIYDYSARIAKQLYLNKNVSIKDRFTKTFNKNSDFLKIGADTIIQSSFNHLSEDLNKVTPAKTIRLK